MQTPPLSAGAATAVAANSADARSSLRQLDGTALRPHAAGGKLRVVYVAGSGHTGSTLVAMLLDAHPRIVSVGEVAVKPKIRRRGDDGRQICSCGATLAECPFWQQLFQRVNDDGLDFGPGRWTND